MAYVNMLPHTWSQDHSLRFVATTGDEVNQLAAVLQTTLSTKKGERAALSYMLLILSPQLFKRSALMQEMVSKQEYPDLYLAAFSETLQELPRECKTIISINSNISKIVRNTDAIEQINDFYADSLDNSALPQYAKLLYRLVAFKERAQSASFPAMLTFMDMFHCAQPVQLNVMRRWRQSRSRAYAGGSCRCKSIWRTVDIGYPPIGPWTAWVDCWHDGLWQK